MIENSEIASVKYANEVRSEGKRRYETLDMLRGVAASAVVIYHLTIVGWPIDIVPHGYLAVDFFFILSGFVMALRYRQPLTAGMTLKSFFSLRLSRIYPLAFAGFTVGAFVTLCLWCFRPQYTGSLVSIVASLAMNLFMVPSVFGSPESGYALFPENGALWSLFFELVINFVWAWVGVRLSTKALIGVLLVSGAIFATYVLKNHTANLGWNYLTIDAGFARVCFGFTLGLVIYRAHLFRTLPNLPAAPILIGLLLVVIVAAPFNEAPATLPWWDLASVFVFSPAIILLGVGQGRGGTFGDLVGQLSYPLYAIHHPILVFAFFAGHLGSGAISPTLTAIAGVAASYLIAWLAWMYYDKPLQQRSTRLRRRRAADTAAASHVG